MFVNSCFVSLGHSRALHAGSHPKVTLGINDFGESCRAYFRFRADHLKELLSLKIPPQFLFSPKLDQNANHIRYAKVGSSCSLLLLWKEV